MTSLVLARGGSVRGRAAPLVGWGRATALSLLAHAALLLLAGAVLARLQWQRPNDDLEPLAGALEVDTIDPATLPAALTGEGTGQPVASTGGSSIAPASVPRPEPRRRPHLKHTATMTPESAPVAVPTAVPAPPAPVPQVAPTVHIGAGSASDLPKGDEVAGAEELGAMSGSSLGPYLGELTDRLQGAWRPKEVYGRVDPHGQLAATMFTTVLDVRLRADGSLERARVIESSGLPALDEEAVDAFKRAQPLPKLPADVIDDKGGFGLHFGFYLDVAVFRFASQVQHTVRDKWRPSPAFRRVGDKDRSTVAHMLLTREGVLIHAFVLSSSGMDFLDAGALAALQPGLQLPAPPPAFKRPGQPGLVPIEIEFVHRINADSGLRVLRPHAVASAR